MGSFGLDSSIEGRKVYIEFTVDLIGADEVLRKSTSCNRIQVKSSDDEHVWLEADATRNRVDLSTKKFTIEAIVKTDNHLSQPEGTVMDRVALFMGRIFWINYRVRDVSFKLKDTKD